MFLPKFFPEEKDMPSGYPNFRKNLVTIPSCDEHNLGKSHDDEYVFMIIIAHYENNEIAQIYFKKVLRAISYRPENKTSLNIERFHGYLDFLIRGIYFREFHKAWNKKFEIIPLSLYRMPGHDNYLEINQRIVNLKKDTKIFFKNIEKKGSHSEIFFYQIFDVPKTNQLLLRMVFYEEFEILAMKKKEDNC
jgi:hypothetical protein